ncbi:MULTISPECIES: hypothetical protein [Rickettsia]|uniref:Uncharacterized protein n=2 Tax=Rickettsia bellii TaxID=33990 RepID=A0A0F3QKD9_RICBE|nr:hypothetical protein [Rickettsia bellii]ABV79880.1 hypothetical protein A1I_07910 [Rickettsia bellii OSU 85-389]KJV90519.1 hypothetical protein RBEAN4_1524 [Rickettsia bellii str. RML An4]KJV92601.1 hypothetical protein RBEMOGI_1236 [Rickettsia bellii str. RML Mogi]
MTYLITDEDIQETIFVASNKELSDSIIEGLNTPIEKCIPIKLT